MVVKSELKGKKFFKGKGGHKKKEKKVLNKKERRKLKLKSKKHSEIVIQLLPLWEDLRKEQTPKQRRFELIDEILKISKNTLVDLCMAHDTSRIFECSVQHATELQRWKIYDGLQNHFVDLVKARYGKFVMIKLINYGEKDHRNGMLKAFTNRIARLVKHKFACEVVDTLYNDYATAVQRGEIIQELYGNKRILQLVENRVYTLADVLKLHADKKMVIMNNLTLFLNLLINKGLNKYSIVQHLFLEYLKALNSETFQFSNVTNKKNASSHYQITESIVPVPIVADEDTEENTIKSIPKSFEDNFGTLLETLIEETQIIPMLHTRDGVRIALHILWASNVAKRKLLVKGLKTCVVNIATNEHGHLFLIGLLDCVDDVVLLQKTIIKEVLEDLDVMITHPNARKVLLYALSPRDRRHFSPQFIESLFAPGNRNLYTKKPLAYRALELRTVQVGLLPALLRFAEDRMNNVFVGNCDDEVDELLFTDLGRLVLLGEILLKSALYHLDPKYGTVNYARCQDSADNACDNKKDAKFVNLNDVVSVEDRNALNMLRKRALKALVLDTLVPTFTPVVLHSAVKSPNAPSHDQLRQNRRRKAIENIEQKLAKKRKLTVKTFTSGEMEQEEEEEEADVSMHSVSDAENDEEDSSKKCSVPFMERFEGHLLLRRLLQEEKQHKDYTFGRMIMKFVPAENFVLWTQCNRSCFILVNLYELGDAKICEQLRDHLSSVLDELQVSLLPGAKILYKHLAQL